MHGVLLVVAFWASVYAIEPLLQNGVIFGDSYSDNGNFKALTAADASLAAPFPFLTGAASVGGYPTSPPYCSGKLTNDRLWFEADRDCSSGCTKGDVQLFAGNVRSYAFAAAQIALTPGIEIPGTDFQGQIDSYFEDGASCEDTPVIYMGLNDLSTFTIGALQIFGLAGPPPAAVAAFLATFEAAFRAGLERLINDGGVQEIHIVDVHGSFLQFSLRAAVSDIGITNTALQQAIYGGIVVPVMSLMNVAIANLAAELSTSCVDINVIEAQPIVLAMEAASTGLITTSTCLKPQSHTIGLNFSPCVAGYCASALAAASKGKASCPANGFSTTACTSCYALCSDPAKYLYYDETPHFTSSGHKLLLQGIKAQVAQFVPSDHSQCACEAA